jgi:1-acyl-sn-glycerol-3-phosphate acyltransferase
MNDRLNRVGNRFLRRYAGPVLRPVAHALLHGLVRVRWDSRERIPARGSVVIVANHHGIVDAAVLALCLRRDTAVVAKNGLFGPPPARAFFRSLGAIPVRRGASDEVMIRTCEKVLHAGHAIAIFPEGTLSPGPLLPMRSGALRIALATDAPVVPLGFTGNEGMKDAELFRHRLTHPRRLQVTIRVGTPWWMSGDPTDDADLDRLKAEMGGHIAALLPPEKRGAYA